MEREAHLKVLVISGEELGWAGVRDVLRDRRDVDVVEVSRPQEALERALLVRPNLIFAATTFADRSVVALLRDLNHACPDGEMVLLGNPLSEAEQRALEPGQIAGHVVWEDLSREQISRLVDDIGRRHLLVLSADVAARWRAVWCPAGGPGMNVPELSPQHRMVLEGLAEQLTLDEVSAKTGIPMRTVNRLSAELRAWFNVQTLFALGAKTQERGVLAHLE